MSKRISSSLHELIQSMSKSEKRYFKVFSSRHTIGEENNYIRIFDYIEQLEEYNEELLFEYFEGEAFLNKFSITKNRLYESILKALDAYHANSSVDAQIFRLIHGAEILYKKSLYNHAHKQLISAEKLAIKHEKHILQVEINKQLKKIIESKGHSQTVSKEVQSIFETNKKLIDTISYYTTLWQLKGELFAHINTKGQARSKEDIKNYVEIKAKLDQLGKPEAPSFENTYLYNHVMSAYFFAINEKAESLTYLEINLTLYKNNPNKIQHEPNIYFSILTNIIHLKSQVGDYKTALIHLNELKTFPDKYKIDLNEDLAIKLFSSKYSLKLMLYTNQGEFEKAAELASIIEEGLRLYTDKITLTRKAYLAFKLAVAFFGLGDYHTSLKWLNQILNDNRLDEKEDLLAFAQILNLLVHLELKNERLLPYALKSTQRFLKKRNRTYQFETIFLKYISKIAKSTDRFEEELILKSVQKELDEIKKDPLESIALDYFDFSAWIEAKLKCKTFQETKQFVYLSALK